MCNKDYTVSRNGGEDRSKCRLRSLIPKTSSPKGNAKSRQRSGDQANSQNKFKQRDKVKKREQSQNQKNKHDIKAWYRQS